VPALDAVAFVDPRKSQVDIVQAVGRAMRKPRGTPSKTTGYIILPVFLSKADLKDPETAVEGSAFAPVLQVLRALKAHDPYRAPFFAKILVEQGKRPHKKGDDISEILQVSIGKELDRALAKRLEQCVQLRALTVSADTFQVGLEHFQSYVRKTHTRLVEQKCLWDGYRLGQWVSVQRHNRKQGSLALERIAALDQIGFVWDVHQHTWDEGIRLLAVYKSTFGTTVVPHAYEVDGFPLGVWAADKRSRYPNRLTSDQIETLNSMHFAWNSIDAVWERGYAQLCRYAELHGDVNVPSSYVQDDFRLGQWVTVQRRRNVTKRMPQDQRDRLLRIKFEFDPIDAAWDEAYQALLKHLKAHKWSYPADKDRVDGVAILAWLRRQIQAKDAGKLTPAQAIRLEALDIALEPKRDSDWENAFNAVKKFNEQQGANEYPRSIVFEGIKIGVWAKTQRKRYAAGTLSSDRVARLESINFNWNPHENAWDAAFQLLCQYAKEHGSTKVPVGVVFHDFSLGAWLNKQRNNAALSPERKAALERIGVSFSLREDAWERGFAALKKHVSISGTARPKPKTEIDGVNVTAWVTKQRSKKGILSADQIKRLEALPGWVWSVREEQWLTGLDVLRSFRKKYGNRTFTQQHIESGFSLGNWVANKQRRPDQLSENQKRELRKLGIDI
jgi:hypothetical protein